MKQYPMGLGVWIAFHSLARRQGDWRQFAKPAADCGIKWVAVRSGAYGQDDSGFMGLEGKKMMEACAENGIAVYTWHYSIPSKLVLEIEHMERCRNMGVAGHIIDAEAEWQTTTDAAEKAKLLVSSVQSSFPDWYVAHAPLAWLAYHQDFPYAEFDQLDDVHPQSYWTELKNGQYNADFVRNCLDAWNQKLWTLNPNTRICQIGSSYGQNWSSKIPGVLKRADLDAFLDRMEAESDCYSIYSWEAASSEAIQCLLDRQVKRLANPKIHQPNIHDDLSAEAQRLGMCPTKP